MRRVLLAGVLAGGLALTATAAAQDPAPPDRPAVQPQAQTVTVEGCVTREADVPGRKPNVAERAGVTEDYILTSAKVVRGSAPGSTAQARPGDTPVGTAGKQAMYEIEGIGDEQLKQNVGRRVQIDGTFENVDRARATPEPGTPADDLVEIRGTTIRQVAGDCAAK